MTQKTCRLCNQTFDESKFPLANISAKTGKRHRRRVCGTCYYHTNQRKNSLKHKERFREFKKTLKCNRCPEDDWRCLEFHHIDSNDKHYNIGDMVAKGFSLDKIKAEANKCEVLCANCHRKETLKDLVD